MNRVQEIISDDIFRSFYILNSFISFAVDILFNKVKIRMKTFKMYQICPEDIVILKTIRRKNFALSLTVTLPISYNETPLSELVYCVIVEFTKNMHQVLFKNWAFINGKYSESYDGLRECEAYKKF